MKYVAVRISFIVFIMGIISISSFWPAKVYAQPTLYLPWINGESRCINQEPHGNWDTDYCGAGIEHRSDGSHALSVNYEAWDFAFAEGSKIYAAAPGIVVNVVNIFKLSTYSSSTRTCVDQYNADHILIQKAYQANQVVVRHSDGTYALYYHLKQTNNGAANDNGYVTVNESIKQGQVIGEAGTTGCSQGGHLHFSLAADYYPDGSGAKSTIPAVFSDQSIETDQGKPRAGKSYVSGNPKSTLVRIQISLPGISNIGNDNNNPIHSQRSIQITIYDINNQIVADGFDLVTYMRSNGNFVGTTTLATTFQSGSYTINLRSNNSLRKSIPKIVTITSGSTTSLEDLLLISGDIDNNNNLNIFDYNSVLNCYSDLAPPKYCPNQSSKDAADLNDDGRVQAYDYNIILRNFTQRSGE